MAICYWMWPQWTIRGILIFPIHTYAYYKHSACLRHPSSHMLGYISTIMVTILMIRAIYFKWVIISGRLYLVMVMRALTDILQSGNRSWWWATEECYYCVLSFSPCVSVPHCCFTSLSFASIYESQVRSSQVLPFCRTTACRGILKEDSGNVLVTQSLCCVFIELWRIYDSNLIWCITFSKALVLHV